MSKKEVKKLNKDVIKAIKWAAAEYNYIKELEEEIEEVKKADPDKKRKELRNALRILYYISRAGRRAAKFEEEVEEDLESIYEKLSEHLGEEIHPAKRFDFSEKRELMNSIRKILKELKIEHNSLVRYASFYEGLLKQELTEAEVDIQLLSDLEVDHSPKKAEQLHNSLSDLLNKIQKQVIDAEKWVSALEASLKKAQEIIFKYSLEALASEKIKKFSSREKLERHLLKKPDDQEAWAVYSDLLQEQGEPLGEYIAIMQGSKERGLTSEQAKRLAEISPKKLNGLVNCFFIEEFKDRYRLHNVPFNFPSHKGELHIVDWKKEKLDGGETKPQENWINWLKGKEWKLPDLYEINAVIFALWNNREHPDPIQRKLVYKFRKHLIQWTMTSTRIEYNPKGKDIIRHNWDGKKGEVVKENIKGQSGIQIRSSDVSEETVNVLLGTSNKGEINKAYAWFNNVPFYIWRLTPETVRTTRHGLIRVVGFGAGSDGVGLYCGGHPSDRSSASGVKIAKQRA